MSQKTTSTDQLALFAVAGLVNPLVLPGSVEAKTITVTSGLKCSESFKNSGPLGFLVRTLLVSSAWSSSARLLTWKVKATKSKRLYFRLLPSMPPTSGTEYGLLPTPAAHDGGSVGASAGNYIQTSTGTIRHQNKKGGNNRASLAQLAINSLLPDMTLWATPQAHDFKNLTLPPSLEQRPNGLGGLPSQVRETIYPTPTVTDSKNITLPPSMAKRKNGGVTSVVSRSLVGQEGHGLILNSRFVGWLMGYPDGWTDLPTK